MKVLCSLLSFLFLVMSIGCAQSQGITEFSVSQFDSAINSSNVQLIDVRTAEEYSRGFIKDARLIDQGSKDFIEQCSKLDKTKPVYVYCLSGGRSASAAKRLVAAGFTNVINLKGGVMAWREAAKTLSQTAPVARTPGMSMADFKAQTAQGTVLVEFYAPWCVPCKELKPVVESIEQQMGSAIKVLYIDVDKNPELASALKVNVIPVLQVYKKGKRTWHKQAVPSREEILKQLL